MKKNQPPEPLTGQRMMITEGDVLRDSKLYREMGYITQDPKGDLLLVEAVKSALEGVIKYHEEKIKRIIVGLECMKTDDIRMEATIDFMIVQMLESEYESVMILEHWLEDVI